MVDRAIKPECKVGTLQEDTTELSNNQEIRIDENQDSILMLNLGTHNNRKLNSNEKHHIITGINESTHKESKLDSNEKHRRKLFEDEAEPNVCKLKLRRETSNSYRIMDYSDYIQTNESQNRIAPQKYQCQLGHPACFPNRSHLYKHYARAHFKQEIRSLIGNTKRCPVCDMEHKKSYDMITHVGSVHSYVDQFLPLEYQIKPKPMSGNKARESITKSQKKTEQYKSHKCPVCDHQFNKKSNLNRHMGNKHAENEYKQNLIIKHIARRRSLNDQLWSSTVHSDVEGEKENDKNLI